MSDSIFGKALAQLQQGPLPDVLSPDAHGSLSELSEALAAYDLEACWNVISPRLSGAPGSHSQKNYFSAFKDLLNWAEREGLSLTAPPPHFGPEFQHHLQDKYGDAQASINTRLSQARRFFKLFRQAGAVAANIDPFSILERSKVLPGQHRDYYSEEEVSRLLAAADLSERAMVLFGAHAGLTTAELLALRWSDVSLTDGTATLAGRQLPLSDDLYRVLYPLSEQQGGGALFTRSTALFEFQDQNSLRARIYGLCLKGNVPYRAWRGLRHAAGLRFFRQSGDLEQVARQLGVENHHLVRVYREVVLEAGKAEGGQE